MNLRIWSFWLRRGSGFGCFASVLLALGLGALGSARADSGVPAEPARNPYAADALVLPSAQPSLKPGAGAGLVTANCSQCHSLDYVSTQPPLTRAQWTAGVEKMRARFGASVSSNQVPVLVDYLAAFYGPPTR